MTAKSRFWRLIWLVAVDHSVVGVYRTRKEAERYVKLASTAVATHHVVGVLRRKDGDR